MTLARFQRDAKSAKIYFAHPKGGGPIKIGVSRNVRERLAGLDGWSPHGIEMLATIPGAEVREAALKWLFRSRRWNASEWFAPDVTIWRVIIEAQESGDLSWLPAERATMGEDREYSRRVFEEVLSYFGSRSVLAERLGYRPSSLGQMPNQGCHASPSLMGRFEIERLTDARELPSYLLPPAPPPSCEAA